MKNTMPKNGLTVSETMEAIEAIYGEFEHTRTMLQPMRKNGETPADHYYSNGVISVHLFSIDGIVGYYNLSTEDGSVDYCSI